MSASSSSDDRIASATAPGTSRRVVALTLVVVVAFAAVAGMALAYRAGAGRSAARSVSGGAASSTQAAGAARTSATTGAETTHLGEVRVSRDFGAETLISRRVHVPASSTVMSLLASNARVERAYGGGFVNSIDGVASGFTGAGSQRADWFYFVNGMQSDRGAADYSVSDDDSVWWDFHRWDFAPSVPAVIGQFPHPFVSGRAGARPTTIEYADGFSALAHSIAARLSAAGATRLRVAPLVPAGVEASGAPAADAQASGAPAADAHRILVGTWAQLTGLTSIADAAAHPASSGLFAHFETGRLVTFDVLGSPSTPGEAAGVVLATARADQPTSAIWLLSGTEPRDVEAAAALLAGGAPRLRGRFGVAVLRDGSVLALPAKAAQ